MDNLEMLKKIAVEIMGAKTDPEIEAAIKSIIRLLIG